MLMGEFFGGVERSGDDVSAVNVALLIVSQRVKNVCQSQSGDGVPLAMFTAGHPSFNKQSGEEESEDACRDSRKNDSFRPPAPGDIHPDYEGHQGDYGDARDDIKDQLCLLRKLPSHNVIVPKPGWIVRRASLALFLPSRGWI